MSEPSYSRCWIHMIWATFHREAMLPKRSAALASKFLTEYSAEKGIYMKINFVNSDHAHALIDLPTNKTIEQVAKLFKGASSHWVNERGLLKGRFSWGRGYGAFSVSHSDVGRVAAYIARIARQEEHHKKRSFSKEYELFVIKYGLKWSEEIR
jgi:putative transposase